MIPCTNCGEYFTPGSINQTKCRSCLAKDINKLTSKLQEVNKQIMGDWNKSVSEDTSVAN